MKRECYICGRESYEFESQAKVKYVSFEYQLPFRVARFLIVFCLSCSLCNITPYTITIGLSIPREERSQYVGLRILLYPPEKHQGDGLYDFRAVYS